MIRSALCMFLLCLAGVGTRQHIQAKPLTSVGVHAPLQGHRDVVAEVAAPSNRAYRTVCEDVDGDGVKDRCRRIPVQGPTLAAPKKTAACQCNPCRCVNCRCGQAAAYQGRQKSVRVPLRHRIRFVPSR